MMSFTSILQNRNQTAIYPPTSSKFTQNDWATAFNKFSDGSDRDKNLFELGIFLTERLAKVRAALAYVTNHCNFIPMDEANTILVRILNSECTHFLHENEPQNDQPISIEEINESRVIKSRSGGQYTSQEAVEILGNSSRHVFRDIKKRNGFGSQNPVAPLFDNSNAIGTTLLLAQFYEAYEQHWQDALWIGAQFRQTADTYEFDDCQSTLGEQLTVDLMRRKLKYHRDSEELKKMRVSEATLHKNILCLQEKGRVDIKPYASFNDQLQHCMLELAYQLHAIRENNLNAVLSSRGAHTQLKVHEMLRAWLQIAFIAVQQMNIFLNDGTDRSATPTPPHSVEEESLLSALSALLNVEKIKAKKMLGYLTYEGRDMSHEVWHKPLIKVSGGYLLIWPALVGLHPMRLLAKWSQDSSELKIMNDARGHPFEDQVIRTLSYASTLFPAAEKPVVLGPGLKIKSDNKIGDIDGLMVLGSTVFVLEILNVPHGATPYEAWDTANKLEGKIKKAIIKREHLKNNANIIHDIFKRRCPSLLNKTIEHYVAVIVSNSYFFEGLRKEDPYFIHIDSLSGLIGTGGWEFADVDANGEDINFQIPCFDNGRSPDESLIHELAFSIKYEYYQQQLISTEIPNAILENTEPSGMIKTRVICPPKLGQLSAMLNRCSFNHRIHVK